MGEATLAGIPFRLDPEQVSWSFQVKTSETQTIGGKVVQVYGVEFSDMVIRGSFGRGGWPEQTLFLGRMKELAEAQTKDHTLPPSRFTYPPKGWDFKVYLKEFRDPAGPSSIHMDPTVVNPQWQLTLFIVQDNLKLKEVAKNAFIERLADGIGWSISDYNGPQGWEDAAEAAESAGFSLTDAFSALQQQGVQVPGGTTVATNFETPTASSQGGVVLPAVDVARLALSVGLSQTNAAIAVAIAQAESGFNTAAHNPVPPDNSVGLWQINLLAHTQYTVEQMKDPNQNAAAMARISGVGSNWNPWSTYTNGAYEGFLSAAEAAVVQALEG